MNTDLTTDLTIKTQPQDLTKAQAQLKPATNRLLDDQTAYDPFKDNAYLEEGTFLLNRFAKAKKIIEDQRLAFTKPLNDSLKAINAFFKTFSEPLAQADRELRDKLTEHRRVLEDKRIEEQKKIEEENRKLAEQAAKLAEKTGEPVTAPVLKEELPDLKSKIGGVVVKKVWTFKIDNKEAIPHQYLAVDEVKIRAAITAGVREIPGIIIYQEDRVSL